MKVFKNYLFNLAFQILTIILPIITTPYISRVLGADGVGLYTVSYSITNYFILFGMVGISTYGARQIAYCRDERDLCSKTFFEINTVKTIAMVLSISFFIVGALFFTSGDLRLLYFMQGITLLSQVADISWFYAGLEKFSKTATKNIIIKLISIILIFTFVKHKNDIFLYALIISSSALLGQLSLWFGIKRYIDYVPIKKRELIKHFKATMKFWVPSIAINVYNSVDRVMLGFLVDNTSVGLYESSQKIVKIAATITTSLSAVMAPNIANRFKNGQMEEIRHFSTYSLKIVSLLSFPMCFGIIALRNNLVPWFYGSGFESVSTLLLFSSFLTITLGWSSVFGPQILVSCGQESKYTIAVFVSLGINLVLNFCFIPLFHETGAIIASLIAEYTGMITMFVFCKKMINIKDFFSSLPSFLVSSLIMCAVVLFISHYLDSGVLQTLLLLTIGVLVYFGALLLFRDKTIASLKSSIFKKGSFFKRIG